MTCTTSATTPRETNWHYALCIIVHSFALIIWYYSCLVLLGSKQGDGLHVSLAVATSLVQEDPLLGLVKLPLPPWRRKAAPKAGHHVYCIDL